MARWDEIVERVSQGTEVKERGEGERRKGRRSKTEGESSRR